MSTTREQGSPAFSPWVIWLCFFAALGTSVIMIFRSQVWGHQFEFLVLGWALYAEGQLLPYGCTVTGGGLYPGPLTSLLFGVPLFLWEDFRTPYFFSLLSQVVAYLLLHHALRETLSRRGLQLLFVFYWLNPWRMYFSGHGWNVDWLFLLGALHFWSAFRLRRAATFGATLVHVLSIGAAAQLHGSFVILVLLTLTMLGTGYIRFRWSAFLAGCGLFAISIIPWIVEALREPGIIPTGGNTPGRGLLFLFPILRGILYWFRYGSLFTGRYMMDFDFTPVFGPQVDAVLAPLFAAFRFGLAPLTLAIPLVANYWLWRKAGPLRFRFAPGASAQEWLIGATRVAFICAFVTFALSPQTIVMWHLLIVLHMAILPIILCFEQRWIGERGIWVRRGLQAMIPLKLVLMVAMAFGVAVYRPGGRNAAYLEVREHYPMIDQLGISRSTPVIITDRGASLDLVEMGLRKRKDELYTFEDGRPAFHSR